MLTTAQRAQITVVLVGARNPGNIGAAARAMQDFGFSDLRIVNTYAAAFEAAQLTAKLGAQEDSLITEMKSAVGAGEVMRNARRFDTLASALADCTFVAGTTAIGERTLLQPVVSLREGVPRLLHSVMAPAPVAGRDDTLTQPECSESAEWRTAILFGSEKTGLTREQLSFCSLLVTIPMFAPETGRHLSMNLGQSVAVVLYELVRDGFEGSRELAVQTEAPATVKDKERLLAMLLQVMEETGYARRFPANAREHVARKLVQQLGESHLQAATWMGLLKQTLKPERPEKVVT